MCRLSGQLKSPGKKNTGPVSARLCKCYTWEKGKRQRFSNITYRVKKHRVVLWPWCLAVRDKVDTPGSSQSRFAPDMDNPLECGKRDLKVINQDTGVHSATDLG